MSKLLYMLLNTTETKFSMIGMLSFAGHSKKYIIFLHILESVGFSIQKSFSPSVYTLRAFYLNYVNIHVAILYRKKTAFLERTFITNSSHRKHTYFHQNIILFCKPNNLSHIYILVCEMLQSFMVSIFPRWFLHYD